MELSTTNLIAIFGCIVTIVGSIYLYGKKKITFNPGHFFVVMFFSFGTAAGLFFSVGCIGLVFFNVLILDFSLENFLIPALIGSLGGTVALVYYLWRYLSKEY